MEERWSSTVQDYYPITPRPRWGGSEPVHPGLKHVLDQSRQTFEAVLASLHNHREALFAIPTAPTVHSPYWDNIWFSCLDGAALVGLLLERRPRRYMEIGSGNSTLFARHAIRWGNLDTKITSIDPQPRAEIDDICDEVIRSRLEDCAPAIFDALQPGDILFFDGSHRVFTNSDTTVLFFEILPRLAPGVLVHLHDIFLPSDYPAAWNGRLYSEQYLLGAMLMCGSPPFTVTLPCYYVCTDPSLSLMVKTLFDGRPEAPIPFTYGNDAGIPAVSFWLETAKDPTIDRPNDGVGASAGTAAPVRIEAAVQAAAWDLPASSIVEGVTLRLTGLHDLARLVKAWVDQAGVAVFDFAVRGHPLTFEALNNDTVGLRVEVFGTQDTAKSLVGRLNLTPSTNGRFLAVDTGGVHDLEATCGMIAQAMIKIVNQVAQLVSRSSDTRLLECIGAVSPLIVVDVGANNLSEPPYSDLRHVGLCKIIGFEPQQYAFDELQRNKSEDEDYFPFAIGAPGTVELNLYSYSGFTSTYKLDESTIALFPEWYSSTRLQGTVSLDCVALDDVPGLPEFDLLKIDIQAGELHVFRNARRLLANCLCVITEVNFFPLYEKAPSFAEVHQNLVEKGFVLHKFLHQVHGSVANVDWTTPARAAGRSQIIDGDAVYLKDYRNMDALSSLDIKKIALLGHFVFSSRDLVSRMLSELFRRGEISGHLMQDYVECVVAGN